MVFLVLFHLGADLCGTRKTRNLNDKTYEFKNVEHAVGYKEQAGVWMSFEQRQNQQLMNHSGLLLDISKVPTSHQQTSNNTALVSSKL